MNYYTVTVGFETEKNDQYGNPKLQKSKYAVQALSVEEATIVTAKYLAIDSRASQVLGVQILPIECVIDSKNEPEYYG